MRFRVRFSMLFLISIIQSNACVFGQEPVPKYLLDYSWLESRDKKNWEKSLNQINAAEEYIRESNELYIQAFNVEKDASISESKRKSQSKKLASEANDKSIKALLLYKDSYKTLLNILEFYLPNVSINHQAKLEFEKLNAEAGAKYSSAGGTKTPDEQTILAEANDIQLLAIEKAIICINTPAASYNKPQKQQSPPSEDVKINSEMYEMYQQYINNEEIPAPIAIQNILSREGDDMTYEAFALMWSNYQAGQSNISNTPETIDPVNVQTVLGSDQLNETTNYGLAEVEHDPAGQSLLAEMIEEEKNKENTTDQTPVLTLESLDYSEFRVQVAASKSPLSIIQIQAIYKGELSIIELKEGSYFKYQIRGFRLANEAQKVCSNSGVSGAYVQSYFKGESTDLGQAIKDNLKLQKEIEIGTSEKINDIEFSVQIAASRIKLSNASIDRLYSGQHPVTLVMEDGWYKYQILTGNDLNKAYSVLESANVRKAFMVAYRNGKKLKLYNALKQYKNYTP